MGARSPDPRLGGFGENSRRVHSPTAAGPVITARVAVTRFGRFRRGLPIGAQFARDRARRAADLSARRLALAGNAGRPCGTAR
jgi:hypothetical protein